MRRLRVVSSTLAFGLLLWSTAPAHAQETITNVSQLARQFGRRDLLCLPVLPWLCHAYPVDGQPGWVDLSQFPKEFSPPATVALPEASGVKLLPLRLTCNLPTGETIVQAEWSGEEIACIAAPADYRPDDVAAQDEIVLGMWQQWKKYAQEWEGGIDPFTLVLPVKLADIKDKAVYDANVAAEEAAWEKAQASLTTETPRSEGEGDSMLLSMGAASCPITNEATPFAILRIQRDFNRWTIIWQSCGNAIYGVFSVDELSLAPQWISRVGMWGGDGTTSWTDATTTNVNRRFYKVRRILPTSSSDWDADGMPDVWEAGYGLNPFDASDAEADPDNDG